MFVVTELFEAFFTVLYASESPFIPGVRCAVAMDA